MDCCHRFILVLVVALLYRSAAAETTYSVLDTAGWSIPTTHNNDVYHSWAANKQFKVGDVLVFDFHTDAHDVTEVTEANYNSCGKTDPISTVTIGPANVNLTTIGMHYYICSFGMHCEAGQKLAVNVTAAGDDSNTKTPATATPPSSSASSITFGGFSIVMLSIILVVLLH